MEKPQSISKGSEPLQFKPTKNEKGIMRLQITDKDERLLDVRIKNVSSKSNKFLRIVSDKLNVLFWKKIYLPTGQKIFINRWSLSKRLQQSTIDKDQTKLFLEQHKLISKLCRADYSLGDALGIVKSVKDLLPKWKNNAYPIKSIDSKSSNVIAKYNSCSKEVTLQLKTIGAGSEKQIFLEARFRKGKTYVRKQPQSKMQRSVEKEHENLQKYHSPYIVKSFRIGGEFCAEFMNKGSLEKLKLDGEGEALKRRKLMQDFCKGVQVVHNEGYVHNDIKPENILVKTSFQGDEEVYSAKLADFGTEQPVGFRVAPEGTLRYMSPEKCASLGKSRESDKADDIWSLGMTYYDVKYGNSSTSSKEIETTEESEVSQEEEEPERKSPTKYKQECMDRRNGIILKLNKSDDPEDKIIMQCLAEDPKKRPTIDQVLQMMRGI